MHWLVAYSPGRGDCDECGSEDFEEGEKCLLPYGFDYGIHFKRSGTFQINETLDGRLRERSAEIRQGFEAAATVNV